MTQPELTPAHRAVLDALDEEWMVRELQRLIPLPSVTGTDAESELQNEIAGHLTDLGMEVDLLKLDLEALQAEPDYPGTEAERAEGYGVVGVTPGEGEVGFILQGHIDVVPTGDLGQWTGGEPFSGDIVGDVLHGRGACDMKAGVVANMAVARVTAE
ncbi:MAG: M20/M25/M40 family metallo-hydrolase [Actinomycetia bacterium]|nr:M20/M25/M40 family metallo-hydrolase [Actinomycetes bacterium]